MHLFDDQLRGLTVITADGKAIGDVASLTLDTDTWAVVKLQIKLRREVTEKLGMEHPRFRAATLELPVRHVQSVRDAVILGVELMQLRQVISAETEPAAAH